MLPTKAVGRCARAVASLRRGGRLLFPSPLSLLLLDLPGHLLDAAALLVALRFASSRVVGAHVRLQPLSLSPLVELAYSSRPGEPTSPSSPAEIASSPPRGWLDLIVVWPPHRIDFVERLLPALHSLPLPGRMHLVGRNGASAWLWEESLAPHRAFCRKLYGESALVLVLQCVAGALP
jgi:hypothetical protein